MPKLTRAKEWVGGTIDAPGLAPPDGPIARVAIWTVAMGRELLANELLAPGEDPIAGCVDALRTALREAPDRTPSCVRVASRELAAALRAVLPASIEVVRAPTPEVDDLAAALAEFVDDHLANATPPTYLAPGVDADGIASIFRAAARLHRAAPWDVFPDDTSLLAVTIDALDVREQVVSVIGQAGEGYAMLLFRDAASFDDHVAIAESLEEGEIPELVSPNLTLNFEPGEDLAPVLREEIATHGWEVAGPEAYPWVTAMQADLSVRPPTPREHTILDAVATALVDWIERDALLAEAWDKEEETSRTSTAATPAGTFEVTLRVLPNSRPRFEGYFGGYEAAAASARKTAVARKAKKAKRKQAKASRRKNR
jgi:hypothetical protein